MINFDEYIRQGEPSKKEKAQIWQTAIGLQDVDGLQPSDYLLETAKENIEGNINFGEVKNRIDAYYKSQSVRQTSTNNRTEEADKVSARIAEILSEQTFSFSPIEYVEIHSRLFAGIYKFAGKMRDYNIAKAEWVLDGETVLYASSRRLKETLEFDFEQEKKFIYKGLEKQQIIEHIAHFIANLWQIHIFGEGNTRTTAVFLIKYLSKLGFKNVNNNLFAKHSLYFRNALVRANYEDLSQSVHKTDKFLILFLFNLLLGENNELKNRTMHIKFAEQDLQMHKNDTVNAQNVGEISEKTVEKTVEKILAIIKNNPHVTQKELAELTGLSRRGIEWNIAQLKQKGILTRTGSDKSGSWKTINSY
ncbi:MAG: Fic family protein [Prevotellaceae bacterium]|nr:Fic family protein [Prevotellaceae bacterium]